MEKPRFGTLVIIVDKARNLPNRKKIGKQDAYAIVRLGHEVQRTPTDKRAGQVPSWNHEIRFKVPDASENMLKISIFNEDSKIPDLIGDCTIDLTDLYKRHEYDNWFDLKYKDKPAGEIYAELTFYYEGPPKPHPKIVMTQPTHELLQHPRGLPAVPQSGRSTATDMYPSAAYNISKQDRGNDPYYDPVTALSNLALDPTHELSPKLKTGVVPSPYQPDINYVETWDGVRSNHITFPAPGDIRRKGQSIDAGRPSNYQPEGQLRSTTPTSRLHREGSSHASHLTSSRRQNQNKYDISNHTPEIIHRHVEPEFIQLPENLNVHVPRYIDAPFDEYEGFQRRRTETRSISPVHEAARIPIVQQGLDASSRTLSPISFYPTGYEEVPSGGQNAGRGHMRPASMDHGSLRHLPPHDSAEHFQHRRANTQLANNLSTANQVYDHHQQEFRGSLHEDPILDRRFATESDARNARFDSHNRSLPIASPVAHVRPYTGEYQDSTYQDSVHDPSSAEYLRYATDQNPRPQGVTQAGLLVHATTPAEYSAQYRPLPKAPGGPPARPAKIPLGLTPEEYDILYR